MPIYEYVCEQDGTVIELMRPMSEADAPVDDPQGRGRTFKRQLSAFMPRSGSDADRHVPLDARCPCGKPGGGCGMA